MYTYRGGYLNAVAEVISTGMSSESVYLWTLPMFHCNGWCFTWAMTAVGGTHVCLRAVDPDLIWDLFAIESSVVQPASPEVCYIELKYHEAQEVSSRLSQQLAVSG